MKSRCLNSRNEEYHNYGGRGIKISGRWLNHGKRGEGFSNFLADMGERPLGMSIERIDNNGNYEPGNCKWATEAEQKLNTRHVKKISRDGKFLTQQEWSFRLFGKRHTIAQRIHRGWSLEDAMNTPEIYGRNSERLTAA